MSGWNLLSRMRRSQLCLNWQTSMPGVQRGHWGAGGRQARWALGYVVHHIDPERFVMRYTAEAKWVSGHGELTPQFTTAD